MSAWRFIFFELLNISLKIKEAVLRCVYFDVPNFINLIWIHWLTEVRSDSVTCSYCHENLEHIYIKKIILLQEASIRALKMSGGRFEAALEFLPKQQQQQQQNEPVNGISKGASSGKLVNLLLHDPLCVKWLIPWSRIFRKELIFSHLLKISSVRERDD